MKRSASRTVRAIDALRSFAESQPQTPAPRSTWRSRLEWARSVFARLR